MADIVPFRGVLYRSLEDAARLLAPPYDVLGDRDRAEYAARHPENIVRLILPEGDGDAKYEAAAALWRRWRETKVLERDDHPAIYRYHQTFAAEGREYTRKGFISLLKLERFGEGSVMPHERTLAGPKMDRLKLMRACHAHFSQIFMLYSDPDFLVDRALGPHEAKPPIIEAKTPDGVLQKLWRVTDSVTIKAVQTVLVDRKVYIADGHHRYETMVTLRNELRTEDPTAADPHSAAQYGAVFLSNMDDPQLVVLPTHRVVHSVQNFDADHLFERARAWFETSELPWGSEASLRAALHERGQTAPTVAVCVPNRKTIALLSLRSDIDPPLPGVDVVRRLDVTVLHGLLLERVLGISREAQEKQTNIRYVKDTGQALEIGQRGTDGAQVVFLMNATSVHQVKAVADAGEVMPQKSTFFVPKLASGIVINAIDPAERI